MKESRKKTVIITSVCLDCNECELKRGCRLGGCGNDIILAVGIRMLRSVNEFQSHTVSK